MLRVRFYRVARAQATALLMAFALCGCRAEETEQPVELPTARASEPAVEPDPSASAENPATAEPEPEPEVQATPYTPASSLGPPIEIREASNSRAVYVEPDSATPLRGRINRGDSFHVYAHRDAPGCKQPWAQVAEGGWVCLERTALSEAEPRGLPILAEGERVPFVYVRHRQHDDASTPAIPVYASVAAFNRGDEPVESLPAYGSYAFVQSKPNRGARVYLTEGRRAVPAAQLHEFDPSEFAGQELDSTTIPPNTTLAWAVRWKTFVHASADPEAEVVGRVEFHAPLFVVPGEGVIGADRERWFELADGGFIRADDIRRFLPLAPPGPVLAGQITVDVDLEQQVLSVWREDVPVFATLISSGKPGNSTPLGLFRIETKWAYTKMESLPSAKDPYSVDAVPWAMYFEGDYALHAAYWHNLFGHRLSHGCVNLSPRDAKRVFDLVTPTLPAGWLLVHEHGNDPGALIRVRNGDRPIPDRRRPLSPH